MRWVFFTLLAANVALLVWRYGLGLPSKYLQPAERPTWEQPRGVERIRLVGESDVAASAGAMAPEDLCVWVGPFADQPAAQVFIERIAALDVLSALQSEALAPLESFLVYLPAPGDRNATRARLNELNSRNIDSYIVADGELKGAISLGVFSQLSLAQAKLAETVKLGFEPLMKSLNKGGVQYWVSVEEGELDKVGEAAWDRIVIEQFKLQQRQKFCLDVASR